MGKYGSIISAFPKQAAMVNLLTIDVTTASKIDQFALYIDTGKQFIHITLLNFISYTTKQVSFYFYLSGLNLLLFVYYICKCCGFAHMIEDM